MIKFLITDSVVFVFSWQLSISEKGRNLSSVCLATSSTVSKHYILININWWTIHFSILAKEFFVGDYWRKKINSNKNNGGLLRSCTRSARLAHFIHVFCRSTQSQINKHCKKMLSQLTELLTGELQLVFTTKNVTIVTFWDLIPVQIRDGRQVWQTWLSPHPYQVLVLQWGRVVGGANYLPSLGTKVFSCGRMTGTGNARENLWHPGYHLSNYRWE